MPLYFAYGSNLDREAMSHRCPRASPIGTGLLFDHRFFIMLDGYASVRTEPGATVSGLLWDVPADDMPALDDYEEVEGGLYRKATVTITMPDGQSLDALVYIGRSRADGHPRDGYMETVLTAATYAGLPACYIDELRRWQRPEAIDPAPARDER